MMEILLDQEQTLQDQINSVIFNMFSRIRFSEVQFIIEGNYKILYKIYDQLNPVNYKISLNNPKNGSSLN